MRSGRNLKWKCIEDSRLIDCNVHEVVYNQMCSKMTFPLIELFELVEGNETSGPGGPAGEESFYCKGREARSMLAARLFSILTTRSNAMFRSFCA